MFFDLPFISIDIGSSSIKIVELTGDRKSKKLRSIGTELIPPDVITDGIIHDTITVEQTLKKLIKKLKIRTTRRKASLSLNGSSLIIKRVLFPKPNDPSELGNIIFYEAEQHFEHDVNDLYFDYFELPYHPTDNEIPVLLVGGKKDIIDQRIAIAKSAGLGIGVIDSDITSFINMFEYNYGQKEGVSCLINIGANITQVIILVNGAFYYTRDLAIGGMVYTKNISSKLGITFDQAENVKIALSEGSIQNQPEVRNIIQSVSEQLISDIQMTIDYFFQNTQIPVEFSKINHIYISGGGSYVVDLKAMMESTIKIPIEFIQCFNQITIPKNFPTSDLMNQSYIYGVSVGLCLREKNDNIS